MTNKTCARGEKVGEGGEEQGRGGRFQNTDNNG